MNERLEAWTGRAMFAIVPVLSCLGISLNWVFHPLHSWRRGLPFWLNR